MHTPAPVHIGHWPPGAGEDAPQWNRGGRDYGEQVRVSALNTVEIDWDKHEIEPHWLGSESATCVAALHPGWFHSQGAPERDRYFNGAAERNETALVISLLGFAHDTKPTGLMSSGGSDSVNLAMTMSVVHGRRLPTRTAVRLATGLTRADEDLGKRLLNRAPDAPWWSLKLSGLATERMSGPQQNHQPIGQLQPIVVDPLGDPVVAVWLSPDDRIRWYIVPDDINWNVVLDWLTHQAIPTYVPTAAQRYRSSSFVDTSLLTPAESDARQALADMETRHAEERAHLEAVLADAREAAEPLRNGLFYGTGDTLVDAVAAVLRDAGFDVVNLDEELGGTLSADLLATLGDHRRLIEVKSAGRNASETLVNDLQRHLQTWPELRPELPVSGGALIVNHQYRLPPADRSSAVYSRREFVATLTEPVMAVRALFDWWATKDWPSLQRAVMNTDDLPPESAASSAETSPTTHTEQQTPDKEPSTPRRLRFWHR